MKIPFRLEIPKFSYTTTSRTMTTMSIMMMKKLITTTKTSTTTMQNDDRNAKRIYSTYEEGKNVDGNGYNIENQKAKDDRRLP